MYIYIYISKLYIHTTITFLVGFGSGLESGPQISTKALESRWVCNRITRMCWNSTFRPEFAVLRVSEFSFLGGPAAEFDSVKRWTLFLELGFWFFWISETGGILSWNRSRSRWRPFGIDPVHLLSSLTLVPLGGAWPAPDLSWRKMRSVPFAGRGWKFMDLSDSHAATPSILHVKELGWLHILPVRSVERELHDGECGFV